MPEFIITIRYRSGRAEHRTGDDARHTRRILGGLKGRYPSATLSVNRVTGTEDVSADFVKEG